jgi:hypothetical protein
MADTVRKSDLELAVEAVLRLPEVNQAEIARFLRDYVEEQHAPSLLTDEQRAEVRRRLADPDPVLIDHDDVFDEIENLLREK